jgi:hypothetical protein
MSSKTRTFKNEQRITPMDTKPTIPDALKKQYALREHLADDLYVIEAIVREGTIGADLLYDYGRHNVLELTTGRKLINYDHQGQIMRTSNPNFFKVEGRSDEGLFSIKDRRLIIPVHYDDIQVLTDTDEFFIVRPRCHYVWGIVNAKDETVLAMEWEIRYKGNCVFEIHKLAGGDHVDATFNAIDGTTIYKPTQPRYHGHYDLVKSRTT